MRLFPRSWRTRYGDEIADHIDRSTRPARDRLDLLVALGPVWSDETARRLPMLTSRMWMRTVVAGLCAVGIVATVLATRALQDGLAELPRHWWSAPAPLPLAAAAVLLAVGEHASRRSRRPHRGTHDEG
jgi:hypothetical protein